MKKKGEYFYPLSQKRKFIGISIRQGRFFNKINFSRRCVPFAELLQLLHGLPTRLRAYLCCATNYYYEADRKDELRRRGFSKQKGLFMDTGGILVSYKLLESNKVDISTFNPT